MDSDYFEADLKNIGHNIRQSTCSIGALAGVGFASNRLGWWAWHGARRSRLQQSCRDDGRELKHCELVRKLINTRMFNILDLTIWRATQLDVDKMNEAERHLEPELVQVCMKA
jgi:hypothetical protein